MGFLKGKKVVLTGVMSNRSIAYGVAQAMHREGAQIIFTYAGEGFKDRVEKIAAEFSPVAVLGCDVSKDAEIEQLAQAVGKLWDGVDVLVHSIAFAPADQLEGDFIDNVSREGFRIAQDISAYSFCALAKAFRPLMKGRNAAIATLTYLGSERVIHNYNTMGPAKASLESAVRYAAHSLGPDGIRVNAISAGPIRTLAASGISGFRKMLDYNSKVAPLRRNVTAEEVGNVMAFICSDLASGITGEVTYVDCGFNTVGVPSLDVEGEKAA